jgi:hypothetical protein
MGLAGPVRLVTVPVGDDALSVHAVDEELDRLLDVVSSATTPGSDLNAVRKFHPFVRARGEPAGHPWSQGRVSFA